MLAKKNVFITGAAKRIGAEITKSLSTLDCNVVIHYNKSSASAKELPCCLGRQYHPGIK